MGIGTCDNEPTVDQLSHNLSSVFIMIRRDAVNRPSPTTSAATPYLTTSQPHLSIDGVSELYECLQQTLDSTWELYPRPFLNGDYPALAALHPIHGLTIFGIYPWNLRNYRCEQRGRYLRYFKRTSTGQEPVLSPVRQTEHYVENLINLYLPHIGESIARDRRSLAAFQVGLYFPTVNTHAAQVFAPMAPGRGTVFGRDAIREQDLSRILPASQRPSNRTLPEDWLDGLRFWLAPPMHAAAQHNPIALTAEQHRHVVPTPGRHQRLHGVAGSGKTLVIAQRAANLAAAGKRVLIVTFNVTLWQYIRQLVDQTPMEFAWENIEFHHFHGFCKTVLSEHAVEWPRSNGRSSKQALDEMIPQLVMETVRAESQQGHRRYDAILIDEGQDFLRVYYDTLCHFLTENDELLFVADRKQNLYLRDHSWLDSMAGTKFRGRWREMKESYRLPPAVAAEVNRFADEFLTMPTESTSSTVPTAEALSSDEESDAILAAQPLHDGRLTEPDKIVAINGIANLLLSWHNMVELDQIIDAMQQTIRGLLQQRLVQPAEIVILTPNQKDGWTVATTLEARGVPINHILSADDGHPGRKQRRFRKRTFAPNDQRIKVSTIHGFKGWELHTVFLLTPSDDHQWEQSHPYLFYVAMTRTRHNLIVFNRHAAYRHYGATWNERDHD